MALTVATSQKSLSVPTGLQTPALLVDPELIGQSFRAIRDSLSTGTVLRFSISCNPAPVVLRTLAELGAQFEVSSASEAELLAAIGVTPDRVLHSLLFRSTRNVEESAALGIARWTVDCRSEVLKIAEHAPGSNVCLRLRLDEAALEGNRIDRASALQLLDDVADAGLQCESVELPAMPSADELHPWVDGIHTVGAMFAGMNSEHLPGTVSLGEVHLPTLGDPVMAEVTTSALDDALGAFDHTVSLEVAVNDALVSSAGVLVAEVTGVSAVDGRRWVFLDVEPFDWPERGPNGNGPVILPVESNGSSEAWAQGVLGTMTSRGAVALSVAIDLPVSLGPGSLLGVGGLGGAFAQRQQILDVRATTKVSQPHGEQISLRDRDIYRAAWPGSALFDECRELERLWFEMSGFVEADGLDGFHKYDAASTFLAVPGPNGDILSTMRVIWSSPLGFKTLNDLPLYPEGEVAVAEVPERKMAEVGTLATHPGARSMGPTYQIFFALGDMMARRDISHFISAIDDGLLEIMRADPIRFPMVDLGASTFYYGAPSTPVIMDVHAYRRQLFRENRPLYRQLIEGHFGTMID